MRWVQTHGGVILYLRQEGRGIGLVNKLKAYNLQDEGLNTSEANRHLGFEVDLRSYEMVIPMLKEMGVSRIRLLTNNPDKLEVFEDSDIEVLDRLPIEMPANPENEPYLKTKKEEMGHLMKAV